MNLRETLCPSLKRADRVLYLVDLPLSHAALQRIDTRTFSNGREQGFVVTVQGITSSLGVAFAQQRNSDHLVLYVGAAADFDEHGVPSEAVYGTKKLFAPKSGKHGAMRAAEEKLAREVTKLVVKAAKQAAKEAKAAPPAQASGTVPAEPSAVSP